MAVISLEQFKKRGELPRFLGIRYGDSKDGEICLQLASRLMQWMTISSTGFKDRSDYWSWHAKKKGMELDLYFEKLLKYLLPDSQAAFADHPWQCLLLLEKKN